MVGLRRLRGSQEFITLGIVVGLALAAAGESKTVRALLPQFLRAGFAV